ncbi:MAG: ATP-binding protein, partial [Natronincolaceae bacterium]
PPDFDDAKIMEIMQNMYENFVKDTGIKTDLIVKGDVVDIDRELGLVIYRCVQESLTNIVRHADADSVTITFDWQKDRLLLTVKDEGCGFSMDEKNNPNDHIGLIGMRERMELVNGKMKIISDVNKGTKIEFTIPFDERGR